jgi:excisionase family DNA binding protein
MGVFYTVTEIATQLKVHPDTVESIIKRKELTAIKFGRQWRVSEQELESYLESRTIKAKKKPATA